MRILFDQGTPVPLRQSLTHHEIITAYERGWSEIRNGALLEAADQAGVEVLVATDLNLKYQQNLKTRRIAFVVLSTPSWPRIQGTLDKVVRAVDCATPGSYVEARHSVKNPALP